MKRHLRVLAGLRLALAPIALAGVIIAFGSANVAVAAPSDPATQVLQAGRAALGGRAIDAVKLLVEQANTTQFGIAGTGSSWNEIGGARFAETYANAPFIGGDGYDGTDVWNSDGSGLVWVDGGQSGRALEITQAFVSNYTLWTSNHGGATVTYAGRKTDSGHMYDALTVTAPGSALPFELWVDTTTHLPARVTIADGPVVATTTFADYRPVQGLMVPYTVHTETNDGNSVDAKVTTVTVNPPDGASHLAKPVSNVHDFSIAGGASETTVPIDLAENHVYLSLMLNGKGPYRFIYDTGGSNIVDPDVAKEVGAAGTGSMQGSGVGSTTESLSLANVDTMQIGAATVRHQLFFIAPTRKGFGVAAGQPVDGIIGFEVLSRFITTFDYAGKRVVLHMPGTYTPPAKASVVPIVQNGRQPQFSCALDGIASQCTVDTGARDSISLFTPFMLAHPQVVPPALTGVGVTGFGMGGAALGRLGRLRSLAFGGFTLDNVVGDFTQQTKGAFAAPFIAANVGGNLWRRFTMTLDYQKLTMALEPNADYAGRDTYERSGLFLINSSGKYVVIDVRPGTPAATAGMVKGDTLVSIDGKTASTLSLQAVRERFAQSAGTVVHLIVAGKDGAQRPVTLILADYV